MIIDRTGQGWQAVVEQAELLSLELEMIERRMRLLESQVGSAADEVDGLPSCNLVFAPAID